MPIDPPNHWQSLAGPNNWYRLWYPPGWTVNQDDTRATLASPDGEAMLSLQTAWSRHVEEAPLSQLISSDAMFALTRGVKEAPALKGDVESIGLQGEALLEKRPPWWKRPFLRENWRRWRIWGLRQGPIILMATLVHSEKPDPEMESLAGSILRTLRFSEQPADPPSVFADRVLALARDKFPLLDCESGEGFQLKLGESNINLFNFYRSYVKVPEKFEEIILPALTTVVQIQGWGSEQSDPPLENVRDRIMPMLYPEKVWEERFPNFVGHPWVGGMTVLYVVDESHAYWYIRNDLLQQWDITTDDLHEIALENLDAYFESKPMEMAVAGGEGGPTMVMPTQPDSYNAVRVLSEDFRDKMRGVMGSPFAIGIPGRDFFVAVNLQSDEMVAHVRQRVRNDQTEMDHPLSDQLLLVSPDGVSEYAG
ncbi:MAG: DUF1444 family protein [Planctomycetaceae bacterium]